MCAGKDPTVFGLNDGIIDQRASSRVFFRLDVFSCPETSTGGMGPGGTAKGRESRSHFLFKLLGDIFASVSAVDW